LLPSGRAQPSLSLTYLGTAGWQIASGRQIILVDPYLTRAKYATPNDGVSADDPRPTVTARDVVGPDTAVIDAHIGRADIILITHTHPDHALDMPYIARKTGATVVGTESTINLARASGVPERQLKQVKGGEELALEGFSVRVIPSLHGIFRRPTDPATAPPVPPRIPADATAPSVSGSTWRAARWRT
jgi:L-ascorbate metabolism protein UlaG (beta-lactamase superfamily)